MIPKTTKKEKTKARKALRLRKNVEANRPSLAKMTPKKQLETCAICLDDITIELEVKLNSCNHRYCGPCITKWVEDVENVCP